MKTRDKILFIVFFLLSAIAAAFLLSKKDSSDTIKIGVVMPQTGFLSSPGQSVIRGIDLFVKDFNAKQKDVCLKMIYEDSQSDPKIGVSAIHKLISADRTKIVIGDIGSPIFLAMAPIAEQSKVVLISPGASNPKVRDAGDFVFRIYTSDEFDGKVMAQYLSQNNVREVSLSYFNNDYGVGLSEAFKVEFAKMNGNVSLDYSFDENNLSFKDLIIKLKNSGTKDVYFIGSPKQDAAFLRQIKEMDCKVNVYGVLSFEDSEFLSIAKGTFSSVEYTTPYFDLDSEEKQVQDFKESFQREYGMLPDLNSALGYDVISIIAFALKRCDYDESRLKDELYQIKGFPGLTGNTSFDNKGDVIKDVMIKRVEGSGRQEVIGVFQMDK